MLGIQCVFFEARSSNCNNTLLLGVLLGLMCFWSPLQHVKKAATWVQNWIELTTGDSSWASWMMGWPK